MSVDKIYAEYRLELDSLKKDLAKVKKEFEKSNKDIKKGQSEIEKGFNAIGSSIVAAFSVAALVQFGKEVINVTAEFQKMEAVLTNTLGSNSAAKRAMADIVKFASETPFQVNELTSAFVKLANQGFTPTEVEMRKLGDLAASTGKEFDQLAEAIIDAQTGEFERLKEFGIRASKEGENVKFTFKGVETQTKFTSEAIREYVLSLGDVEGVSGSMAAISETLGGRLSNLSDQWTQFMLRLGEANSGALFYTVEKLSEMLHGVENLNAVFESAALVAGFKDIEDASNSTLNALIKSGAIAENGKKLLDVIAPINASLGRMTAQERVKNIDSFKDKFIELFQEAGETAKVSSEFWDAFRENIILTAKGDVELALGEYLDLIKTAKQIEVDLEGLNDIKDISEKTTELKKRIEAQKKLNAENEKALAIAKLRSEWNAQRGTEIDEQIKTQSQIRIENARNEADSIVEINETMSSQLMSLNAAVAEDNIKIAQEQAMAKVEAEQFAQQQLLRLLNVLAQDSKALAVFQVLISQGVSIANAIQGATSASAAGGPAAPFLLAGYIASMVGAVVTGFKQVHDLTSADAPQFYEGTEDVTSAIAMHNLKTAKDPYVVRVHPHERIVSAMDNKKLGGISNKELANAVEFYQQYKNFTIGSSSESFDYRAFDKINRKGALTVANKIDELIGLEREKYLHSKRGWQ